MAGSLRTFVYTTDNNQEYLVRLDESTYENVDLGFTSAYTGGLPEPIISNKPIRMRYINCYRIEAGATIRRRFWVGTPSASIYLDGGTIVLGGAATANAVEGGTAWIVSSSIGERRRRIGLMDTGKLDGDVDGVVAGT